jgi:hypothetical protein
MPQYHDPSVCIYQDSAFNRAEIRENQHSFQTLRLSSINSVLFSLFKLSIQFIKFMFVQKLNKRFICIQKFSVSHKTLREKFSLFYETVRKNLSIKRER